MPAKGEKSPTPAEMQARIEAVQKCLDAGMNGAQTARKLGLKLGRVYDAIRRIPGHRAVRQSGTPQAVFRRSDVRMGSIQQALTHQPPELLDWLIDNVPPGGSVADVLTACALDALHEEQDHGKPTT